MDKWEQEIHIEEGKDELMLLAAVDGECTMKPIIFYPFFFLIKGNEIENPFEANGSGFQIRQSLFSYPISSYGHN